MTQQVKIIIVIIILFLASSVFLFAMNQKHMASGQNWWAIYFADAKNKSLNFIIENHTNQTNFYWQVMMENNKLKEGTIEVKKDETKDVIIENINNVSGKIIINVSSGEEKREIYKNL